MSFKTTGKSKVRSVKCCVLFDPENGTILHVHRVVTMEGAKETSDQEVEARTLELARQSGLPTERLNALHVDSDTFADRAHYTVDPHTREVRKREQHRASSDPPRAR